MAERLHSLVAMSDSKRFIRHILFPHDFSETAESALTLALELARRLDGKITLLHAYEVAAYAYPEGPAVSVEMAREIESGARKALEGVAARVRSAGVPVEVQVRQGVPWSEIVKAARELQVDLIAIGTHGRRGFARALLGSVAERVVRMAPCPVLTVHGSNPSK